MTLFSVLTGKHRQRRRRPERTDDELDAVVEHHAVERGQRVRRLVVVVIGDDLDLVLLAADFEPALAVDVFGGEFGGALHRDAPGGAGAGSVASTPSFNVCAEAAYEETANADESSATFRNPRMAYLPDVGQRACSAPRNLSVGSSASRRGDGLAEPSPRQCLKSTVDSLRSMLETSDAAEHAPSGRQAAGISDMIGKATTQAKAE